MDADAKPLDRLRAEYEQDARSARRRSLTVLLLVVVGVALLAAGAFVGYRELRAARHPAPHTTDAIVPATSSPPAPGDADPAAVSVALSAAINDAIHAEAFPTLVPGLTHLGVEAARVAVFVGCQTDQQVPDTCTFRPPGKPVPARSALVIGDTVAMSWLLTVRAALIPRGYVVYGFTRGQCPAAYVTLRASNALTSQACDRHHAAIAALVAALKPSLVFLSSSDITLSQLLSGATGEAAEIEYRLGVIRTIGAVAAPGRTVVVISPPPTGKALPKCDIAGATPAGCLSEINGRWLTQSSDDRAAALAAHAHYLNTRLWSCNADLYCPAFVGTTPVMYDGVHMTREYARRLAPELAAAVDHLSR